MKLKSFLLTAVFMLGANGLWAQASNLVIFSNQGNRFSVVLNGVLQNQRPETNIRITGLVQPAYKVKVLFADKKLGDIDKTVYMRPNMEIVLTIKQNRKGRYVLRIQSAVNLTQALPPPPNQTVIVYGTPPPPPHITQTTVTTTTTNVPAQNNNLNVAVNAGGAGVNMNLHARHRVNAMPHATTTITTTTTSSGNNFSGHRGYYNQQQYQRPHHHHHSHFANGCEGPMRPEDFNSAKQAIANQSFSAEKLKVAKQIFNSNCMSSEQVKQIMELFSFESSKLTFAKYAYGYTTDPQNFYKVNSAFSFSSSVDALNNYIRNHRQ